MYNPAHFHEQRPEVLRAFLAQHPLATLVAQTADGLVANHLPLLCDWTRDAGVLRGHVARANPLWRALAADAPVLAIFGGASAYVSPSWYPSKAETGKVVPTWNYAVVHAHGTLRFFDDKERVRALVTDLTAEHERALPQPWKPADAPPDYLDAMLAAIVGFEIAVARLEGKFKASQNKSPVDRGGVANAFGDLAPADRGELIRDPD